MTDHVPQHMEVYIEYTVCLDNWWIQRQTMYFNRWEYVNRMASIPVTTRTRLMIRGNCIFNESSGSSIEWVRKSVVYESSKVEQDLDENRTKQWLE
jgi:hypothetical protein